MSLCGLCLQPVDVAGSGWALAEECSYALTFSSLLCPPFGRTEPFAGTGVPAIIAMGGVPQPGLTVPTSCSETRHFGGTWDHTACMNMNKPHVSQPTACPRNSP
jgi:hypothetical protein